jgi:hypothetical protein
MGFGALAREFGSTSETFREPARTSLSECWGIYALTRSFRSELAREKMWSRIHLIPLLQAEEDRDVVRRHYAQQKMEEELLGKSQSVYNGDRYVKYEYWGFVVILDGILTSVITGLCGRHMLLRRRIRRRTSGGDGNGRECVLWCAVHTLEFSFGE